jgi:hypothetical protein
MCTNSYFQDLTLESIREEICYGSEGLHLLGAPILCTYSHFQKDLKGLGQCHSVLDQSHVALDKPVISREEHLASSPE